MNYWVASDYHLGSFNSIGYFNRPFRSLEHMNNTIIKNHNARVKPSDTVYHVGDFCMRNSSDKTGKGMRTTSEEWESKLNGKIIHIIGNHDQNNGVKSNIINLSILTHDRSFFLVHDPKYINYTYDINLVGHLHNKLTIEKRHYKDIESISTYVINVGVDVNNFMPITFDEVLKMEKELLR